VQSLEKKVEVEKKVVQSMPGIHTMQNLNEYLRALQEHGVNQVCRDMTCLPRVWRRRSHASAELCQRPD
jgi:uncharacterized protein (DUF1499 family)